MVKDLAVVYRYRVVYRVYRVCCVLQIMVKDLAVVYPYRVVYRV